MHKTRAATPIRGTKEKSSGARYGLFVAPRGGMETLVQAIARRLPAGTIRISTAIRSAARSRDGCWHLCRREASAVERFDAVIIAAPAHCAAEMLEMNARELADELRAIPYASAAVVVLAYRREQLPRAPAGFGIVVPQMERRRIIAASFSSTKFEGRAPFDRVLVRVFVGGACQPELVELGDRELQQLAREELGELIGASGEPLLARIVRWQRAMPQYHVGHLERVARIERLSAELPGMALAGNAYRGVGIPQCIHNGEQAAERVLGALSPQGAVHT